MHSIQVHALLATAEEEGVQSDGVDSDHFSGSNSSFLANEKLMSVDSVNSDITGKICNDRSFCPCDIADFAHP